jgi:integrase
MADIRRNADFVTFFRQLEFLGERGESNEQVFHVLHYSAWENVKLKRWVLAAGITKDITFHSFRHTYATLQLSADTDFNTITKMMGHNYKKTTLIYAKVVDQKKRAAADKIKLKL